MEARKSGSPSPYLRDLAQRGYLMEFVGYPCGEHAEIMSPETVETLLSELNSIPPPDPNSMAEVETQVLESQTGSRNRSGPRSSGIVVSGLTSLLSNW